MLNGNGKENGKNSIGLISEKKSFLYISLPLFCTTTTWNFLGTRFMEEILYSRSSS